MDRDGQPADHVPPAAVTNFASFDFAGFARAQQERQAQEAAAQAGLVRQHAEALFSDSEEGSSGEEASGDARDAGQQRHRSGSRRKSLSRSRSRTRRRSRDRGKRKRDGKDRRDHPKKKRRHRSRSLGGDRGRGPGVAVPAEALHPLLTLAPGERRQGTARWLQRPQGAAGGDPWYLDPRPDRDNLIFGRLHPSDVPRYRRDYPRGAGPSRASLRGDKEAGQKVETLGMLLEYRRGAGFVLTPLGESRGLSAAELLATDSDLLGPEGGGYGAGRYFTGRPVGAGVRVKRIHAAPGVGPQSRKPPAPDFIPLEEETAGGEDSEEAPLSPRTTDLLHRSRQLNVRTREDPSDVAAWLALVRLQEEAAGAGGGLWMAPGASLREKQLAILERATAANPGNLPLLRAQMRTLAAGMGAQGAAQGLDARWMKVLRMHPGSLSLWSDYLQGVLSGAGGGRQGGFSAPAAREALLRALEDLSWERDRLGPGTGARARKELERVEGGLVGVMLRLLEFDLGVGSTERFVAGLQALVEFEWLGPEEGDEGWSEPKERLGMFAEFWNGMRPRAGEPGARGFRDALKGGWREGPAVQGADTGAAAAGPPPAPTAAAPSASSAPGLTFSLRPAAKPRFGLAALANRPRIDLEPPPEPISDAGDAGMLPAAAAPVEPETGAAEGPELPDASASASDGSSSGSEAEDGDGGGEDDGEGGAGFTDELESLLREAEEEALRARAEMELEESLATISAGTADLPDATVTQWIRTEAARSAAQWLPLRAAPSPDDPLGSDRHVAFSDVAPLLVSLRTHQAKVALLVGLLRLVGLRPLDSAGWGGAGGDDLLDALGGGATVGLAGRALGGCGLGLPWYLEDAEGEDAGGSGERREFVARLLQLLLDAGPREPARRSVVAALVPELIVVVTGGKGAVAAASPADIERSEVSLRTLLSAHRDRVDLWTAYGALQARWHRARAAEAASSKSPPPAPKLFRKVSAAVLASLNAQLSQQPGSWVAAARPVLTMVLAEVLDVAPTEAPSPTGSAAVGRARSLLMGLGQLGFLRCEAGGVSLPSSSSLISAEGGMSDTEDARVMVRRGYQAVAAAIIRNRGQLGPNDASPVDPSGAPLSLDAAAWLACLGLSEMVLGAADSAAVALRAVWGALQESAPLGSSPVASCGLARWATACLIEGTIGCAVAGGSGAASTQRGVPMPAARALLDAHLPPRAPSATPRVLRALASLERRALGPAGSQALGYPARLKTRLGALWAHCASVLDEDRWGDQDLTAEKAAASVLPVVLSAIAAAAESQAGRAGAAGVRHLFERALQYGALRGQPQLWAAYMAWELEGGSRGNVGRVVFRAISHVPWSKATWLCGLRASYGLPVHHNLESLTAALACHASGRVRATGALPAPASRGPLSGRDSLQLIAALSDKGLVVRTDIVEVVLQGMD